MLVVNQLTGFGAGGANPALIDALANLGLTTNLKLCLDAGDGASYSGSGQKWLDVSGGGYDFFRGADGTPSTDDPTFNGTAGGLSAGEHWSFDGGDFFRYDAANETWMENLHKNNAVWSFLFGVYHVSGSQLPLFGDDFGSTSNRGAWASISGASDKFRLQVDDGSAPASLSKTGDTVISAGWHILGASIDEPTGAGGGFLYTDGGYNPATTNTWDATYSAPSASNANYTFEIAALGNAGAPPANGARMAFAAMWQGSVLTKANFDAIWNAMRGRLGI